jgi:hypothetical protein
MNQIDTINQSTSVDRSAVVSTLDEIIRSFDDIETTSNNIDPQYSLVNANTTEDKADSNNYHVLDLVQEYASHTSDILRDLKALRKALPATYFKNRSKIRDAFERLEQASGKCQENAYAIIDTLQSRQIGSEKSGNVATGVGVIKAKLTSLLQALEGSTSDV